ncbi:aminopeptidase Ey-like [Haliotis cracherodii]|uniref:aminopeptidase Ey-like n=1 Tax=Haliotis cracherodii TaxID=6455 RepID=UPI0039E91241
MDIKKTYSLDSESSSPGGRSSGCFVSAVHGFILLLLGVAIAVGVGVLVHFAGGRELVCQCGQASTPIQSPEAIRQMCTDMVKEGTGQEICDVCPADPAMTTNTPVPEATLTTTAPPPTPPTTEAPTDYRLPITVRPYLYTLALQPNIYGGDNGIFDFNGSVSIATVAEVAASTITLHAYPTLNIDKTTIQVRDLNASASVTVQDTSYESLRHFFVLHLSVALAIGRHYEISMAFNGPLSQTGTGLYLSVYEEDGKNVYLATTQFEAPHAREAFPCFDEPALKAQFDITLVRQHGGERNYTSLTNTPLTSSGTPQNGMVADVYERTVVMPTYLLAFIVCDYDYVETNVSDVLYRTWAMPKRLQYTEAAQRHGIAIFERYTQYFTPAYVFTKLDNIAIPDFNAGAMENWGLITYRETLLYEPGVSSASDENWIAEVISHEIAHQWFGNLVSPKWWNWLWLNEAFASFWDYHIVGEIYPAWRKLDVHVSASVHGAMSSDSLRTSHPLTADVMTPGDISAIFDTITYTKGSAIIRMMHLAMGQDIFILGLNRYLEANKFGNAEHQDLWDALSAQATESNLNLNMTEVMDPWVTQMNYPVVNVVVAANEVTFTQQRFLVSGAEDGSQDVGTYGYKWTIPVTFTVSDNVNFTEEYAYDNIHYMKVNEDSMQLLVTVPTDGWIIVNIQQCGFYRVNYDVTTWNNIIAFLSSDHEKIHPINRAQIINDAWNLAKAGLLDQSIALKTVNHLSRDLDYAPWRAFIRELGYVQNMLERTSLFGLFEEFMKNTVATPYSLLGTNITEAMPPVDKIEIAQIVSLACDYDYQECVDTAVRTLDEWMADQSVNSIYPDLRSTFYCTAVRHGSLAHWDFVYERYHTEQTSSEKTSLRQALSCTREPWLLQRLLDMSVNASEVRPQDARTTITYVANSRWGRDLAWNFVTHNYAHLNDVIKSISGMTNLIRDITVKFNTEQEYKKVQDFMDSGEDVSGAASAFTQVLERTRTNIEWLRKNYDIFQDWLQTAPRN